MTSLALNAAGQVLTLAGLVMALFGVSGLTHELFPGHLLPHRRALQWMRNLFRRRREGHAVALAGTITGTSAGGGAITTGPARPQVIAVTEAWIQYLVHQFDQLERLRAHDLAQTLERIRIVEDRAAGDVAALRAQVGEVDERMRRALGGREGRGLDFTWCGLSLTVLGVLLQLGALFNDWCHTVATAAI